MDHDSRRVRFNELHQQGTFVMPNPWDIGSAKMLESLGFPALATTSAGFAQVRGRHDQNIGLDELVDHVAELAAAVEVPMNVDSERLFADDPADIGAVVERFAEAGAAGVSIEDYNPDRDGPGDGGIDSIEESIERVTAAAEAATRCGLVLTARAENLLYGVIDLDDTILRLVAYRDAGAQCLYAPGLRSTADIARVVAEVDAPINLLALPGTPPVGELELAGVRRISTGSLLARAAMGALVAGARELMEFGTSDYAAGSVSQTDLAAAFD